MVTIKRMLCPADYSECSSEAMEYAAHIAGREKAKLCLMHVIDIRSFGHESPLGFEVPKPNEETIERIRKELQEDLVHERDGKKVEVEAIVVVGNPVEEILKAAKEKEVDMIVMGTHGRTGLPHVIIGSVAENVVRMAPCHLSALKRFCKITRYYGYLQQYISKRKKGGWLPESTGGRPNRNHNRRRSCWLKLRHYPQDDGQEIGQGDKRHHI